MIKQVVMFTVVCDNCGADVNDGAEYSCWNNESYVEEIASESNWIKDGDRHYCPDCHSFDDEDNLIIVENNYKKNCKD